MAPVRPAHSAMSPRDESETAMAGHHDAQRAADTLALALEDAGFDVGRAFPLQRSHDDVPVVELGPLTPGVAVQLAWVLGQAAERGVTVDGLPE